MKSGLQGTGDGLDEAVDENNKKSGNKNIKQNLKKLNAMKSYLQQRWTNNFSMQYEGRVQPF